MLEEFSNLAPAPENKFHSHNSMYISKQTSQKTYQHVLHNHIDSTTELAKTTYYFHNAWKPGCICQLVFIGNPTRKGIISVPTSQFCMHNYYSPCIYLAISVNSPACTSSTIHGRKLGGGGAYQVEQLVNFFYNFHYGCIS